MTPEERARFEILNAQVAIVQSQMSLILPTLENTIAQIVEAVKHLTLAGLNEIDGVDARAMHEVVASADRIALASEGLQRLHTLTEMSRRGS